jgi:nicotinic acid mononucleotide adenylyltransferase
MCRPCRKNKNSIKLAFAVVTVAIVICFVSGFNNHDPHVVVHASFSMWKKHIPFYSRRAFVFVQNPEARRTTERNMFSASTWPGQRQPHHSKASTTSSTLAGHSNQQQSEEQIPDSWCDIHYLHQRIEQYIQRFQQDHHHSSANAPQNDRKLCFVFAGGGSTFLSTLAATPGASRVLLEGTVTYSRSSFEDYIRSNYNNYKQILENGKDQSSSSSSFKYCSEQAAAILATSASRRAMTLIAQEQPPQQEEEPSRNDGDSTPGSPSWLLSEYIPATGVACTSVLKTESRSYRSHGSRIFINIQNCHRADSSHSGSSSNNNKVSNIHLSAVLSQNTERSRFQEDVFVAHCIMSCLEYVETDHWTFPRGNEQIEDNNTALLSLQLDERNPNSVPSQQPIVLFTPEGDEIRVQVDFHATADAEDIIRNATERVATGQESAVLLVPEVQYPDNDTINDNTTTNSTAASMPLFSFVALPTVLLPHNALIVPGSFNPPHLGHIQLAKAAAQAMKPTASAIFFELSITNADKPPLMADDVVNRLKEFHQLPDMPENWGILLTNAPLFKQKVDLLAPLQMPSSSTKRNDLHFCIGTDTLVRLIDPKYYGHSPEQMIQVLSGMPSRFMVGGRLDQKAKDDPMFFTGQEFLHDLPPDLQTKFTVLSNFRVDISSTELRKKKLVE